MIYFDSGGLSSITVAREARLPLPIRAVGTWGCCFQSHYPVLPQGGTNGNNHHTTVPV